MKSVKISLVALLLVVANFAWAQTNFKKPEERAIEKPKQVNEPIAPKPEEEIAPKPKEEVMVKPVEEITPKPAEEVMPKPEPQQQQQATNDANTQQNTKQNTQQTNTTATQPNTAPAHLYAKPIQNKPMVKPTLNKSLQTIQLKADEKKAGQ